MAGVTLAVDATLLRRQTSGEHGELLTFLAVGEGLLRAFRRNSARGRQPAPDLFDRVGLRLEKPKTGGELWFVSEYNVRLRRPGIGKNYASLLYACRYGLLLSHHLFENAEAALWLEQLDRALDAWERGDRPEVVYFKALYLFARLQGIPVKEEWLLSRSSVERHHVRTVLSQPVADQTTDPRRVERSIADFEEYLQKTHDIRFDTPENPRRRERGFSG